MPSIAEIIATGELTCMPDAKEEDFPKHTPDLVCYESICPVVLYDIGALIQTNMADRLADNFVGFIGDVAEKLFRGEITFISDESLKKFVDAATSRIKLNGKSGDLTNEEIIEAFEERIDDLYGFVGEFYLPELNGQEGFPNWTINRSFWVYGETYSQLWFHASRCAARLRKAIETHKVEEE